MYFVVNDGGDRDSEISAYRAVFYEHDHLSKEVSRNLWQQLEGLEPTIQVDTGGKSIHSYLCFPESLSLSASEWSELQTDLLEYMDADRALKNPSRVMRLAGGYHIHPGRKPIQTTVISQSEKTYTYQQLRAIIPKAQGKRKISWAEFDCSFSFPTSELVPLQVCLSRENRERLENGTGEGERNSSGYALACDLIAVVQYFNSQGQTYEGNPENLFYHYGSRCSPPLEDKELQSIWKSASQRTGTPALPTEYITNCIKAWAWKQLGQLGNHHEPLAFQNSGKQATSIDSAVPSKLLSPEQVTVAIEAILAKDLLPTELATERVRLRGASTTSEREFDQLWQTVEQERELRESRLDRKEEIEQLLQLSHDQLNLSQILEPTIAKPMEQFAERVGATSAAMLLSMLSAIASLCRIGTRLILNQASDFDALPILYTAIVADSGSGKSPAQKETMKPLFRLQEEAEEQYKRDLEAWQADCKVAKENGEEAPLEKPVPQEYITGDVTREAIAVIQASQPDYGFLGWNDELSALFNSQNAYRGGRGSDKEALLSGRDGSPVKVNRASGKRIYAKQAAYSITGTTQPGTLRQLMGGFGENFADPSGQWARFLWTVMPFNPTPYPLGEPLHVAESLYPVYCQVEKFPAKTYTLALEAQALYESWYNDLGDQAKQEPNPAIRSTLVKTRRTTGELALILHITNAAIAAVNHSELNLSPTEQVGPDTLKAAIAIAQHCIGQIRLIYSWGDDGIKELSPVITRVIELLNRKGRLAARDVQMGMRSKKLEAKPARELLKQTAALGYGKLQGTGSHLALIKVATADHCCTSDQQAEVPVVSISQTTAVLADLSSSKSEVDAETVPFSKSKERSDQHSIDNQAEITTRQGIKPADTVISTVQQSDQPLEADSLAECRSQRKASLAAEDQQFAVGQICHYVGDKLWQLKGLNRVEIQALSEGSAIILHESWAVSHTVPLSDLRRIEP